MSRLPTYHHPAGGFRESDRPAPWRSIAARPLAAPDGRVEQRREVEAAVSRSSFGVIRPSINGSLPRWAGLVTGEMEKLLWFQVPNEAVPRTVRWTV